MVFVDLYIRLSNGPWGNESRPSDFTKSPQLLCFDSYVAKTPSVSHFAMTISEADALAAHKAIHDGKDEVTLEWLGDNVGWKRGWQLFERMEIARWEYFIQQKPWCGSCTETTAGMLWGASLNSWRWSSVPLVKAVPPQKVSRASNKLQEHEQTAIWISSTYNL